MTLRLRRTLYITCIIIFLLVAPTLVGYTAGWRYDFNYNRLVSTGSLVVKSDPAAAEIYINNSLFKQETPTIINDILPGKINLEVARAGYHTWRRTVEVKERLTTFVENIKLFRQNAPAPLLAAPRPLTRYWWNRKQDKIAYLTSDAELRIYNTLNQKDDLLLKGPLKGPVNVQWSPRQDKILLNNYVIDANLREKTVELGAITKQKLANLQWDPKITDALYGLDAGGLYRLSYLLKTARLVAAGNIINFLVTPEKIFTLENDAKEKESYLTWRAAADPDTRHRLLARTGAKGDVIVPTNSERIAVANADKKTLLIVDPADSNKTLALENVAQAVWANDGGRLIYSTGQAIYQVNFTGDEALAAAENASQLLTRYSQPIADIFLSDNWAYLFYVLENSLRVLETNDLTAPQSLVLLPGTPKIAQPEWIDGQKLVTFIDANGQLQGLDLGSQDSGAGFFSR